MNVELIKSKFERKHDSRSEKATNLQRFGPQINEQDVPTVVLGSCKRN